MDEKLSQSELNFQGLNKIYFAMKMLQEFLV